MRNLIYFLCGIVVLVDVTSCVDTRRAKNYNLLIDESSVAFVQKGLEVSQTEIKASKLAATHSNNSHLASFASQVLTNHVAASDELEKIAINNKIKAGDSVNTTHQQAIKNMALLSGTAFDKAYIQLMVADYESAVKLYITATNDRIDAIQSFARKTLPVLRMHLDSATTISANLK